MKVHCPTKNAWQFSIEYAVYMAEDNDQYNCLLPVPCILFHDVAAWDCLPSVFDWQHHKCQSKHPIHSNRSQLHGTMLCMPITKGIKRQHAPLTSISTDSVFISLVSGIVYSHTYHPSSSTDTFFTYRFCWLFEDCEIVFVGFDSLGIDVPSSLLQLSFNASLYPVVSGLTPHSIA